MDHRIHKALDHLVTAVNRPSVAQFPKKEQTKVDRSTVVLKREARAVISLNGVTQQGHQQLSASLNLEDLLRQTVEGQGKEDVAFANKKAIPSEPAP